MYKEYFCHTIAENLLMEKIKIIGFDADDTLWVNEPYYREAEDSFCKMMESFMPQEKVSEALFSVEMQNLERYGYGAKSFVLSALETALKITGGKLNPGTVKEIINLGKSLLEKPVELLGDVNRVLQVLKADYRLIIATKGDLPDQQRKLKSSGLLHHFHHIEIMSDKKEENYRNLLRRLDINADEFLMVGNSLKSDILPVVAIGGKAVHIPYHITWQHETIDESSVSGQYSSVKKLSELPGLLSRK